MGEGWTVACGSNKISEPGSSSWLDSYCALDLRINNKQVSCWPETNLHTFHPHSNLSTGHARAAGTQPGQRVGPGPQSLQCVMKLPRGSQRRPDWVQI